MVGEEARKILEFFISEEKRWWKVMPMGDLNMYPALLVILVNLQMEWYTLYKDCRLKFF